MGEFFDEVFLPMIKKLVEAGNSYEEVKRLVKIPSTWGAKISGGAVPGASGQLLLEGIRTGITLASPRQSGDLADSTTNLDPVHRNRIPPPWRNS